MPLNNIFVFDIETIPDLEAGRRIYGLDGLSDEDTAKAMLQKAIHYKKSLKEELSRQ